MFGEVIFFQNFLEFWKVRKILSRHGGVLSRRLKLFRSQEISEKLNFTCYGGKKDRKIWKMKKKCGKRKHPGDSGNSWKIGPPIVPDHDDSYNHKHDHRHTATRITSVFFRFRLQLVLLPGAILNRTYGTHRNLKMSLFLLTLFGPIYHDPP